MISILMAAAAQIALDTPIVRAAPAGEDAAAYVAIRNAGSEDRLVSAACDCAERVEIHRMTDSMHAVPALAVPAGGGVEIRPGGTHHLMLMRLRAPIAAGQRVPITLRFERAGAVAATYVATEDTRAAWAGQAVPAAPILAPELQPLAFLVGSCFRATFPNSTNTDTHCFTILPGGRQIRDTHVVAGAPEPYSGESIYRWDPAARVIRYDYYASDGGYSAGTAEPNATGLHFPEEAYVGGNGQRLILRNTMTREADGYSGRSEMKQGEEWREMWTMRFTRVGPAPVR